MEEMKKGRVLVTGATGFIGRYIVDELLKEGYDIRCLVRKSSKIQPLTGKENIEFFVGDTTDPISLHGISDHIDFVIHLAAVGHVSSVSEAAFQEYVKVNETGTRNLVNEFRKSGTLKKFVHFSSTAAMGHIGLPVLNEGSKPNPVTPYQKSKLRSERVILEAVAESNFPGVIVRPCMVYGVGGKGEFLRFCKWFQKGIFPKVGMGKNLSPLVYVTDVVQGAIAAMKQGVQGEVYLIASDRSISMDELRHEVVSSFEIKSPYLYVPAWVALSGAAFLEKTYHFLGKEPIVTYRNIKSTITDRTLDISKAKRELGYTPTVKFHEGIRQTIDWYKANGIL